MTPSAHLDSFARDNLPPRAQWPDFLFDLPELNYPDRINCAVELLDRWIEAGDGDRPCLISPAENLSYAQLAERVNRIANVLTRDLGLVPGQSRAAARPQQPDDGCGLSRRHQGRRRRGRDHAAAARQGDRLPDHQGEDPARAVRPPPGRRDGEGAAARRRTRARRVLGQRHARRARSADGASPATSISPPATPPATTSA